MKIVVLFLTLISISSWADSRVKIAVLDTGVAPYQEHLLCEGGRIGFGGDQGYDTNGHGTNVISILTSRLDKSKYCIISYKVLMQKDQIQAFNIVKAIEDAISKKVSYINLSFVGDDWITNEYLAIQYAVLKKIHVFVAAGNSGLNLDILCHQYPACYYKSLESEYFKVVGAYNYSQSNKGSFFFSYSIGKRQGNPMMTGTSQATPNAIVNFILGVDQKTDWQGNLPRNPIFELFRF